MYYNDWDYKVIKGVFVAWKQAVFLRNMRQICESIRRKQSPVGATEPVQGGSRHRYSNGPQSQSSFYCSKLQFK